MAQGYSGGFFLPAQRSVHCKGGFFASATRTPAPASNVTPLASKSHQQPKFPVLFTLPQAGNNAAHNDLSDTTTTSKHRARRVYDPEEGDEDTGQDDSLLTRVQVEESEQQSPSRVQRSNSTSRFVRGRQTPPQSRTETAAHSRAPRNAANNNGNDATAKPKQATRVSQRIPAKTTRPDGDINNKFELAMQELNQIKGEFDLKQQRYVETPPQHTTGSTNNRRQHRQNSAPALVTTRPDQPSHASMAYQFPVTSSKKDTIVAPPPLIHVGESSHQPQPPPSFDLQSPRQRLQVAEMVMRKLYKKNLQTEQELAAARATNDLLTKKVAEYETGNTPNATALIPSSATPAIDSSPVPPPTCAKCSTSDNVDFVLVNPPSMETISRIDQQQLDYLRHLAAEQDRTITSLKVRIEELSTQLVSAKQQQQHAPHTPGAKTMKSKSTTPRQVVNKLQSKLQDARHESERQKSNYLKLKRDFQHLLALKTKTLYENPQVLNASARGLVELMEKQLKKLEVDHSVDLAGYNSKLYEIEQQSCESYAQKRMMEEEMDRVAKDVQQRDAIDVEIEQCIANVFERLHHVESENLQLKKRFSSAD